MAKPDIFDEIIQDLETCLMALKEEGVHEVEMNPDLLRSVLARDFRAAETSLQPASNETGSPLEKIALRVSACKQCPLHEARTHTVPGEGCVQPDIMFIGEGPGADEDRQGRPFVGRAGKLLDKIIAAMGYERADVFIGNIVKCRPPNNRPPMPDEMEACMPYLIEQIDTLKPKVIVALGATAVKGLLDVKTGITKLRGVWKEFNGTPLMPTLHPAYLLRNPAAKRDVWEDMKKVLHFLGKEPPEK